MTTSRRPPFFASGMSLIEVVIAMGVLAVAFPLVFAVFAKSSDSAASAKAETRCSWIIPACMHEIEAGRDGHSRVIAKREPEVPFSASGEVLALAFTGDGRLVDTLPAASYQTGAKSLAGETIRYLVAIRTELAEPEAGPQPPQPPQPQPMLNLRLTLEYPAAIPAAKRRTLDFHSRIP
ncbi:MAG: hypothetical protein K9N23_19940 [Akkermansiaceae bacterium]|nr:hypothetical protein [Akkermansiaceae bacterium]